MECSVPPFAGRRAPYLRSMRIMALALGALLGASLVAQAGARDHGPPTFQERPGVGQPVRFTDAAGLVFQPDRLVVLGRHGVRAARLPAATLHARSEEHVNLSGVPLIGQLFRGRLAPGDAKRRGVRVGPLTRVGDTLVLDARHSPVPLAHRALVLTANFPRTGAVSYRLGVPDFTPARAPSGTGHPAGTAWLVGRTLVLAGAGYAPAIGSWEHVLGTSGR